MITLRIKDDGRKPEIKAVPLEPGRYRSSDLFVELGGMPGWTL